MMRKVRQDRTFHSRLPSFRLSGSGISRPSLRPWKRETMRNRESLGGIPGISHHYKPRPTLIPAWAPLILYFRTVRDESPVHVLSGRLEEARERAKWRVGKKNSARTPPLPKFRGGLWNELDFGSFATFSCDSTRLLGRVRNALSPVKETRISSSTVGYTCNFLPNFLHAFSRSCLCCNSPLFWSRFSSDSMQDLLLAFSIIYAHSPMIITDFARLTDVNYRHYPLFFASILVKTRAPNRFVCSLIFLTGERYL